MRYERPYQQEGKPTFYIYNRSTSANGCWVLCSEGSRICTNQKIEAMMLNEMREEIYSILERVKTRAGLMDRPLDVHDLERVEALMGQIEVFTKQHRSNCE